MMVKRSLAARLHDILDNIANAKAFVGGLNSDQVNSDPLRRLALERAVEIISEASRHLPDEMRAKHPQIPWRNIAGTGNWLRHAYERVDTDLISGIVQYDLDPPKAAVESLLTDVQANEREE